MRPYKSLYFLVLLLAGLTASVAHPGPLPAPLDQEEYLNAQDWFNMGLALNSAGNYRDAAEAFARSIAVDPENPLAWLNLGTAQALSGDPAAALDALEKAVRLDPKLALGYANLGEVYLQLKRFPEAVAAYGTLLKLWPNDANAHFKLGMAYLYLGDTGKAQGECLALQPLDPELAGKLNQAISLGVKGN